MVKRTPKGERKKIITRMVKLWNSGMTAKEIQKEYPQITTTTIYNWIHTRKNAVRRVQGFRGKNAWKPVEDWKVWWLYHNTNLNVGEIAEVIHRSKSGVSSRMNSTGIRYYKPTSKPPLEYQNWVIERVRASRIIENPQGGVTCDD